VATLRQHCPDCRGLALPLAPARHSPLTGLHILSQEVVFRPRDGLSCDLREVLSTCGQSGGQSARSGRPQSTSSTLRGRPIPTPHPPEERDSGGEWFAVASTEGQDRVPRTLLQKETLITVGIPRTRNATSSATGSRQPCGNNRSPPPARTHACDRHEDDHSGRTGENHRIARRPPSAA
jgi:hypothetical protein